MLDKKFSFCLGDILAFLANLILCGCGILTLTFEDLGFSLYEIVFNFCNNILHDICYGKFFFKIE